MEHRERSQRRIETELEVMLGFLNTKIEMRECIRGLAISIYCFSARQNPAALQRAGTRTNIDVQQILLKEERMKDMKEINEEEKGEEASGRKPPPGAVKMPGADILAGALKKKDSNDEDDPDVLLAELKAM